MDIPILNLKRQYDAVKPDIDAAISEVLESQRFIRGPQVKQLEDRVAAYLGVGQAAGVASGTDALLLALEALGLGPGDEVITSAFTFVATAETIFQTGARPVFVDIEPATFNLDPEKIPEAIGPKTRGILPVHLFGLPADLDPILRAAGEKDLWVLEDCAQAFGAAYRGKKVGGLGRAGAFSFFPSKNLGGFGDGGMITTDDAELCRTVRVLSEHGGKDKYNATLLGHNSRLDTIQAAVLLAKLRCVDAWNENRRRLAAAYREALAGVGDLVLPSEPDGRYHTYNQFTVRTGRRDDLQRFLAEGRIGAAVYYPYPLHRQELFQGNCRISGSLAETEKAAAEVISLPIDPLLRPEEQAYVISRIKEFYA